MSTLYRFLTTLFALALCACGGGDPPSSLTLSPAKWETPRLWFGAMSVGSTSEQVATLRNTGTTSMAFTSFANLPAGMTAQGCASVAAGAACAVTFTYKPGTAVQEGLDVVTVSGQTIYEGLPVVAWATDQPATLSLTGDNGAQWWSGSLAFMLRTTFDTPLELTRVRFQLAESTDSQACQVTLGGAFPSELAGRGLEVGPWAFRIPAQGTVETRAGKVSTTWTQPRTGLNCYWFSRGYESSASMLPVKMY